MLSMSTFLLSSYAADAAAITSFGCVTAFLRISILWSSYALRLNSDISVAWKDVGKFYVLLYSFSLLFP